MLVRLGIDIFDKFDDHRVRQIIELVAENHFGQIFITDTHRNRMAEAIGATKKQAAFFDIEKGLLKGH